MKFFASFKEKRFRYGTLSTVMILFAVAIFFFVNLVVDQLDIKADLTGDQRYSLSSYSKEFLAGLQKDVNIYALIPTGQEQPMLTELLREYESSSSHIKLEFRDPTLYPTFVEQFATDGQAVASGSIVVQCGEYNTIIAPNDMYTYDQSSEQAFQYYMQYGSFPLSSVNFEPQISKAIHNVTIEDMPVVYELTGSGESTLQESFLKTLSLSKFQVKSIDLTFNELPEDCDILLASMPAQDWSKDTADRILAYLQRGGSMMAFFSYGMERFPNLDYVLSSYGVAIGDYFVVEGSAANVAENNPGYLIPNIAQHEITTTATAASASGYRVVSVASTGINELPEKRINVKIEPLLSTSNSAYGRLVSNTEAETLSKTPDDIEGPFNIGVAITESVNAVESYTTRLVIFGTPLLLEEYVNTNFSRGTNWDLILGGLNWMSERESIYIPAYTPAQVSRLSLTQVDANVLMIISIFVLPLIFVAAGVFVWFRRRHN
jgi:ABC-2 type transport system permease protein